MRWGWARAARRPRDWWLVFVLVALVSGLLTGALGVGDALRASLLARVEARVGPTDLVVDAGEGFFSALLAAEVAEATGADVAPLLRLEGVGRADGISAWMMLLGVDDQLAKLAPDAPPPPGPGEVVLREDVAAELGVGAGDAVVFRFERPSLLSRDIALVQEEGRIQPLRLTVAAIAPAAWPMTFALDARPLQAGAALVDRAWLAEKLGRADEANLLVVRNGEAGAVTAALDRAWQLSDGGLSTTPTADGGRMLLSERVLLPPPVADAAAGAGGAPVLTWFADSLSAGERAVPYAFVAGVPEAGAHANGWFQGPEDLGVVLQRDTAARLGAGVGSVVKLRYPVLERGRQVRWLDADLTVRAMLPADNAATYWMDPAWSPVIEGLSGKSRCRDWNPGLPVDLGRVGDADEAWWTAHGPTPQAFVPVGLAKRLWASGWGDATGVRFGAGTDEAAIDAALHAALSAASVGLVVREVRGPMLASAAPSNDFGVLFLSFEGILILALLALLAIGGAIVVDGRAAEIGLVRAVGWSGAEARRWVLAEAFAVVAIGALVGIPVGIGVRAALLFGLQTAWWKATGALAFSAGGLRAAWAGPWVAAAVSALTLWWAVHRQLQVIPRDLLLRRPGGVEAPAPRRAAWPGWGLIAGAVAVAAVAPSGRTPVAVGAFFAAGAAAMIGGVWVARAALHPPTGATTALWRLALAGAARRPGRSLSVVGMVAAGVFIVIGTGLGAGMAVSEPGALDGGAGGYSHWLDTALPIVNPGEVIAAHPAVDFTFFRRKDGDDASCLQLGTANTPHLVGVDTDAFVARGGFRFVDAPEVAGSPWSLLVPSEGAPIPAIGDQSTVTWGLHLRRGDRLTFHAEDGAPFDVEIVGVIASSVFQGALLVDERAFLSRFPGDGGYRGALVDARGAGGGRDPLADITRRWSDLLVTASTSAARLDRFAEVEHTYIAVFRALGGLGMVVGGLGVALLVVRSVDERRGELMLLRALGWRRSRVMQLIVMEHAGLLAAGVAIGVASALVAALPAWSAPDAHPPWLEVLAVVLAVWATGGAGVVIAAQAALGRVQWRALQR